MATLGERLKMERESRGVSIKEIADVTNINMSFLEGLEADDYSEFPAEVFIIGFLRSYSNHLGLDSEKVIFDYESIKAAKNSAKSIDDDVDTGGNNIILILVLVVAFISATGYVIYKSTIDFGINRVGARSSKTAKSVMDTKAVEPSKLETTEVSKAVLLSDEDIQPAAAVGSSTPDKVMEKQKVVEKNEKVEPVAEKPKTVLELVELSRRTKPASDLDNRKKTEGLPTPDKKSEPEKVDEVRQRPTGKYRLELFAGEEDVWILVLVDGDRVRDMFIRSGQKIIIRADKSYLFTTGNARHLKLVLNGKDLKIDVPSSGVIRNWEIPVPPID